MRTLQCLGVYNQYFKLRHTNLSWEHLKTYIQGSCNGSSKHTEQSTAAPLINTVSAHINITAQSVSVSAHLFRAPVVRAYDDEG